jgi:hypothetical protein
MLLASLAIPSFAAQEIPAQTSSHLNTQVQPEIPVALMSSEARAELEANLSSALQRRVDSKHWFEMPVRKPIRIKVYFDMQTELLVVDLGKDLSHLSNSPEMEDLQGDLQGTSAMLLNGITTYKGMELRYGGKTT